MSRIFWVCTSKHGGCEARNFLPRGDLDAWRRLQPAPRPWTLNLNLWWLSQKTLPNGVRHKLQRGTYYSEDSKMCVRKLEIKGTLTNSNFLDTNRNYFALDQGAALQDARSVACTYVHASWISAHLRDHVKGPGSVF